MRELFKKFTQNKDGATIVEYALIVGLISIVAIAVLVSMGPKIRQKFQNVDTALSKTT